MEELDFGLRTEIVEAKAQAGTARVVVAYAVAGVGRTVTACPWPTPLGINSSGLG